MEQTHGVPMTDIDPTKAANWSINYRRFAGINQRQLAALVHTSPGVIGELERGRVRSRRVALLIKELVDGAV